MRFQSGASALRGILAATLRRTKGDSPFTSTKNPEVFEDVLNNQCVMNTATTRQGGKFPQWVNSWNSETNLQDLQVILNELEASMVLDSEEEYDRFSGGSEHSITDVDDYIPLDRPVDISAELDHDTLVDTMESKL